MSPTQRSLKRLRDAGFLAAVTERWNAYSKTRKDLFNCIDILAVNELVTIGIQATSGTNVSARLEKIKATPEARRWCECPFRELWVWGWAKRGPRGKRKTWECREVKVEFD